ncbi:hypothetical protein CISG_09457 [Coccidioides immitis RMSCC 3703]|uniref:Major facilitator superfamily (MFS) profile domain-containing protein n=1 Tax=Coccidioides immitis RMSCC 3703 TaxID=454286 RepID=A0A0J8QJD2_COCIT|nr:hypothetical protein CISG_09457 [Coccidioides immitis RMSCC 3703]
MTSRMNTTHRRRDLKVYPGGNGRPFFGSFPPFLPIYSCLRRCSCAENQLNLDPNLSRLSCWSCPQGSLVHVSACHIWRRQHSMSHPRSRHWCRDSAYAESDRGRLAAIASPKLGVLSDGYGRTKVIALATLGAFLGEVITVLVAARPDTFSLNFLLLGATFDGLFGSFTTAVALTQSYAADCIPPERRNVAFGYFHGVLFSGIALGPLIAGYLIRFTNNVLVVFYSVLGCQALFLFCITFIVPESVPKENQEYNRRKRKIQLLGANGIRPSWKDFNPLGLLKPLSILFPPETKSTALLPEKKNLRKLRRNLIILSAIDTSIFGVAMGTMSVLIIYAEYMFGWGNFESSMLVSLTSSVRVLLLLVVLPTATRFVRGPASKRSHATGSDMLDIVVIRISVLFDMLGYVGSNGSMGRDASPILQSPLTKHVPADRTGSFSEHVSCTRLLDMTVATVPQTVFICLAGLIFIAFLASLVHKCPMYTYQNRSLEAMKQSRKISKMLPMWSNFVRAHNYGYTLPFLTKYYPSLTLDLPSLTEKRLEQIRFTPRIKRMWVGGYLINLSQHWANRQDYDDDTKLLLFGWTIAKHHWNY